MNVSQTEEQNIHSVKIRSRWENALAMVLTKFHLGELFSNLWMTLSKKSTEFIRVSMNRKKHALQIGEVLYRREVQIAIYIASFRMSSRFFKLSFRMSSSNSLEVEKKFTVFVDRAPIPDEGNSLLLIIVIVVIVLLVLVITGELLIVMTGKYICKCLWKLCFLKFSETAINRLFCSGNASGVREEERKVVLQLFAQAVYQPGYHWEEGTPCAAPSLWETKHKMKKNCEHLYKICFSFKLYWTKSRRTIGDASSWKLDIFLAEEKTEQDKYSYFTDIIYWPIKTFNANLAPGNSISSSPRELLPFELPSCTPA